MEPEKNIEAPETKDRLPEAPDEPKLEPAPELPELEAIPPVPEIAPAQSFASLPASPKKKSKKLLIIILAAIIVLAGASCAAYFLFFNKDDAADTKKDETSKEETKKTPADETKVEYKTFTSKHTGLSFEYPSTWQLKEASDSAGEYTTGTLYRYTTTITSPDGYKVILFEDEAGGLGGMCDPEAVQTPKITAHKEASTKIDGLVVVSYADAYDGAFKLHVSHFMGPYDEPVSACALSYDWALGANTVGWDGSVVSFGIESHLSNPAVQNKPSADEYDTVVKILASLQKKN